ncbi:hypothetical protein AAMO2058_001376400 [Amorphochlora amoebiformis]
MFSSSQSADKLDRIRYNIRKKADEVNMLIDKIMLKIKETNTAGFVERSFKTWPVYMEQFSQLSASMQELHEAVYTKESFEMLNSLLVQPTAPLLPLPGVMREVMEQLRTRPIDQIEEEVNKSEIAAAAEREDDSKGEGKKSLKEWTTQIDEYNKVCDTLEDEVRKALLSLPPRARVPQQRNRSRNMIQPPADMQKMVDFSLMGDDLRASHASQSKERQ